VVRVREGGAAMHPPRAHKQEGGGEEEGGWIQIPKQTKKLFTVPMGEGALEIDLGIC